MRALMSLARFCVRLYYRESRLGGAVPSEGPVLLVANHPNGLVDPVVMGGVTERYVRFLGKAPLFDIPVLGRIIRGLEVLPVYRAQDGADLTQNKETFERVFAALGQNDLICLFPEGKSHNEPELQRLKTGAARMGLGAEAQAGFELGVQIVPVGLTYRAKRRFGSPVATWVGIPIDVRELRQEHEADDREAVRILTERIAEGLRNVTLSLDRWEDLPLLELAERIFPADDRDRLERLRAFADGVHMLRTEGDERLDRLSERIAAFHLRLTRLGIPVADLRLRYRPKSVLSFALRNLVLLAIGLPLAIAGAVIWAIPYRFLPWLTARLTQHRDIFATYQILGGILLFPLWLAALCAAAIFAVAPWVGAFCLVVTPLLGFFALAFLHWRSEVYEDVRVFLRLAFQKKLRQHLVEERDAIATEIGLLRRDFLQRKEGSSALD